MEIKKKTNKKKSLAVILAIAVAAVMFIPMLYSSIYLGAFWDPYGNLDNVPVAFVNLDKSVTKDDKEYAIGNELEKNLKDNDKVAWKFVTLDEAKKGVESTKYYAMVEIPEDFSQKIADAKDGKLNPPEVIYEANKGRNFVFSQISERVAESLKTEVSSNIQEEISKSLVDKLYDVKVSIKDAANGSSDLQDGTQKLLNGSKELTDKLGTAASGSSQLKDGLASASNGASSLQNGIQQLFAGSNTLSKGLSSASSGTGQLKDGLVKASSGADALQGGTQQLLDGSNSLSNGLNYAYTGSGQLKDGFKDFVNGGSTITGGLQSLIDNLNLFKSSLSTSDKQISALVGGTKSLSDGTTQLKEDAKDLTYDNVNALAQGVNQAGSAISTANSLIDSNLVNDINTSNLSNEEKTKLAQIIGTIQVVNSKDISTNIGGNLSNIAEKVKPLPQSLIALNEGAKQVNSGVNQLLSGASNGIDGLIAGTSKIQAGSVKLTDGLKYAQGKTGELSDGLLKLNNGASSLNSGLKSANDGASNLSDGLKTAASSSLVLSNGLNQLSSGSNELTDGLKSANDGSKSLSDGLKTAASSTVTLADGLNKLTDGSNTITNGLNDANDGANKLKDGLNEGADKMDSNLKFSSKDMSKFVSEPVTLKDTSINDIKFYGEGLAPYFISLSLWLGSMFINLIISIAKNLNVVKGKFLNSFIGKFVAGALMATIQALILTSVLVQALHIDVTSTASFYVSNIFIAIVFFSVMYGVSHGIGIIGTPIMFIVFLLQLSSSGGTFPIETAPKFYRVVSTYFPMTYSISTLRMIIAGVNSSVLHNNLIIMLAFMFGSLCVGLAIRALLNLTKKNDVEIDENLEAA